MPDSPDFFQYRLYSNRHVLGDMAELAVRLGSPIAFDRLGDVIWFSQMDNGFAPFTVDLFGTGADANIISNKAEYGGYSLTLTGGSDATRRVRLTHNSSTIELSKTGLELHVAFLSDFDKLHMDNVYFNGTERIRFSCVLDYTNNNIQCQTDMSSYDIIDDLDLAVSSDPIWMVLKLVVDFNTRTYQRLNIGNRSVNLSQSSAWVAANTSAPQLRTQFEFFSRSGSNDQCLVDLIVQTINEPI